MKYEWDWCELCDGAFVWCPKCGNNCCNGGSGTVDGKECDECNAAYAYQDACYKSGDVPSRSYFTSFPIPGQ